VPSKFTESIDKEQAAIASIGSFPDEGDPTLAAAAKGGNLQAFEVLVEGHEQRMGLLGEVFFSLPAIVNRDESLVCRSSHSTGPSKKPSKPQPRP
jgi:hypothetical protein